MKRTLQSCEPRSEGFELSTGGIVIGKPQVKICAVRNSAQVETSRQVCASNPLQMELVKENRRAPLTFAAGADSKAVLVVCWVQGSPVLGSKTSRFVTSQRPVCELTHGNVQAIRRTRARVAIMTGAGEPQKPEESDTGDENPPDWDSSWKDFQEREENGGVFKLPPEGFEEKQKEFEGERIEKLTAAWSNDTGFLVGIGVIGLIGLFYGYVFATGGISH